MMRQVIVVALLIAMMSVLLPREAKADEGDNDMLQVLKNSFYGGLTGVLIGTAFLAFRDKPGDHTKDIRVGAGVGVIIGTLYGLAKTTEAFVKIENSRMTFHVPTIQFNIDHNQRALRGSIDLLKVPF